MTTTDAPRRFVRPGFLRWSLIVFALLAVVLAHNVWGYVEIRRLNSAIAALVRNGEPVAEPFRQPLGAAAEADRSLRAAAVLAEAFALEVSSSQLSHRFAEAERTGDWPPDLVEQMRSITERHRQAIGLAERVSRLPFEGFKGSAITGGFSVGLVSLMRIVGLDATVHALDGEGSRAVNSLFTEVQLGRDVDHLLFSPIRLATDLRIAVDRVRLPDDGLAKLGVALENLDKDDRPKREIQRARIGLLRNWQRSYASSGFLGPFWLHRLNGQIETMTKFARAADAPWPDRLDRVVAAGEWPMIWGSAERRREAIQGLVIRGGQDTAIVRATRIVAAVERYRRNHGENLPAALQDLVPAYLPSAPIDPFSGKPMMLTQDAKEYVAYSIGSDRRDDGGKDVVDRFASGTSWPRGMTSPDLGIRIRYR